MAASRSANAQAIGLRPSARRCTMRAAIYRGTDRSAAEANFGADEILGRWTFVQQVPHYREV